MSTIDQSAADREALDLLLRGFQVSRTLRLVADLGVADRILPDAVVPVEDLAIECSVLPGQLIRVLRALSAFGIFSVSKDGRISHTSRSRLLRTDTAHSMHHAARFWTAPGAWKAWGELDAAMDGGNPHQVAWKTDRFTYLRDNPGEARAFDAMMAGFPDNRHAAIAGAYDFSKVELIADIGGGNGATLRHILERHPGPRGLLFDREDVVAALTAEELMHGRIVARGGNFFEQLPGGADVYVLSRVLHDWNDEDCVRILRCCRSAMGADARLLLADQILEPDPERGNAMDYLVDMQMMAMFGRAKERTESEFRDLLERTGFVLERVLPTESAVSLVEAVPIRA